ncbi:MAG: HvfC family RiPP maturation protein, partial [Plesiomonas shigelloides]
MMKLKAIQDEFIAAIRDPYCPAPANVPAQRMAVYRELFFNNISGFVNNAFPVLKSLYQPAGWEALLREFFLTHDCQDPLFVGIAGEFLQFLQRREPQPHDPACTLELAHYEWLELDVAIAMDSPQRRVFAHEVCESKAWHSRPLALASHARVAQYHYEVERISKDFQPHAPTGVAQCYCLFRDSDDKVCFLKLSPMTAQVLALLDTEPGLALDRLCARLKALYPTLKDEVVDYGLRPLLQQL